MNRHHKKLFVQQTSNTLLFYLKLFCACTIAGRFSHRKHKLEKFVPALSFGKKMKEQISFPTRTIPMWWSTAQCRMNLKLLRHRSSICYGLSNLIWIMLMQRQEDCWNFWNSYIQYRWTTFLKIPLQWNSSAVHFLMRDKDEKIVEKCYQIYIDTYAK